jgi:hypothetical protein
MLINCGLQISDCGFKDQKFIHHFKQSAFRNPKSEIRNYTKFYLYSDFYLQQSIRLDLADRRRPHALPCQQN